MWRSFTNQGDCPFAWNRRLADGQSFLLPNTAYQRHHSAVRLRQIAAYVLIYGQISELKYKILSFSYYYTSNWKYSINISIS